MKRYIVSCVVLGFLISGCAVKDDGLSQKKILSPESVSIYDIPVNNVFADVNNGRKLLGGFPFVSNTPIIDFKGKFSNQFYDKLDYRYKYDALKDVDFWKLRTNPFAEDFIYVLPTWANQFKRVSNNLFEDIGYSYNLSSKEQEILKWWIGRGGILWIEGGIYSTRYDTFKKNGEINQKAIVQKLIQKSKNLYFFDRKVHTAIYKSKKIDFINYVPMRLKFKTTSTFPYFKDIKNLEVKTDNYMQVNFMPRGRDLLTTQSGRPLVSFVQYGKGGVVFLYPFEFQNTMYDGELLRWKLLYFLLEERYLQQGQKVALQSGVQTLKVDDNISVMSQDITEKLEKGQKVVLNNLEFAFNSSRLTQNSIEYLKPIALYLQQHKTSDLRISGYTDNIGSIHYNMILSIERAKAAKAALVDMGISQNRIKTAGYSELYPIATNATAKGRSQNRRVEFTVIKR
jgi:outer membrane protein OmpA-like peptidoglycan-associated protein